MRGLRQALHRMLMSIQFGRPLAEAAPARAQDPPPLLAPTAASLTVHSGEGVADPRYLLAEVTELRDIADRGGLGTLAYILECARLECIALIRKQELGAFAAPKSSMQDAADLPYLLEQVDELREIAERAGFTAPAWNASGSASRRQSGAHEPCPVRHQARSGRLDDL
jgi:hypothetical protein